ncbi:unnamed protein product [Cladocopium goreaui]|uniref:Uncharacterized protein n=1 Tax=Cladocopium goreaui TaxID=2562237 RepID=A0A9P1BV36_9DINO|nr:unnamed protein product [Cladocopium goreaui]
MIHRRQHGAGSGEGAADESAAGADATAVAEHALVLVPGDRSQCIASIACTKSAQPAEESLDRQDTYGGDHVNTSVDDLLGGTFASFAAHKPRYRSRQHAGRAKSLLFSCYTCTGSA